MDKKIRLGDVVEILGRDDGKGYVVIETSSDAGKVAVEEITSQHLKLSFLVPRERLRVLF